ncbi:LIC12162 family transferase [Pigmentibacter ruber]|uniref:LIC12162 family transferase n=1 Tax=Pigmentibacter ruber TaxID=2683196 RepID=UPI00131E2AC0|nr:LIC12162 family protein [Pigmentibacter ruber]
MFLVITSNEEFWDTEQEILFLGEYCKLNKRENFWNNLNYKTLENIWNDHNKKHDYAIYINEIQEQVLLFLSSKLNEIHGTNYSQRYWRILLIPFLMNYIPNYFDKYMLLKNACDMNSNNLTTIVLADSSYQEFDFTHNFFTEMVSEKWNLQVISQIIKSLKNISIKEEKNIPKSHSQVSKITFYKILFKNIITFIINLFASKNKILNFSQHLSKKQKWSLFIKSLFLIFPSNKFVFIKNNVIKRDLFLRDFLANYNDKNKDQFCEILVQSLYQNLPTQFLEDYKFYHKKTLKYYGAKAPIAILQDTSIYSDSFFAMWFAYCIDKGTLSIGFQHGGGYGDRLFNPTEKYELSVNDYYISWGWGKDKKILPLPSPILSSNSKTKKNRYSNKGYFLLTGTVVPRVFLRYESVPIENQFLEYLKWQTHFFSGLINEVSRNLVIRPHPVDFEWNIKKRLRDKNALIENSFKDLSQDFHEVLANCSLFISDNLNTTFLHSLVINKPTILFWNKNLWESNQFAEDYYTELEKVGIYHRTPESAAKKINEIYCAIETWWNSKEVQNARLSFIENYAKSSILWEKIWVRELKKIIN